MKILLRTRCGCERLIDIPGEFSIPPVWRMQLLPLSAIRGERWTEPSEPTYREFRARCAYAVNGQPASEWLKVYEEV